MKAFLLAVVFALHAVASLGQTTWCLPGAQWHYDYGAFNVAGFIELTYTGDTVYNGVPCHQLDQYIKYIVYPDNDLGDWHQTVYTHESNGLVYAAVPGISDWDTLINFNAVAGDSWGTFPESENKVLVEDTGHKTIQGYNLKYLAVTYSEPIGQFYHDTIYDRLGYTGGIYPFNMQLTTDNDYGGFCNYSDNMFADWKHLDSVCTVLPTVGIFERENVRRLALFPNPTSGVFRLDLGSTFEPLTLSIHNPSGRLVYQSRQSKTAVDVTSLPRGLYFVTVGTHHGVLRSMLVVEKP